MAWQYGNRESFDLNCDTENEKIITGFFTTEVDQKAEDEDHVFAKNIAVAVVQNPMAGRPQSKLFSFQVSKENSSGQICSDEISISLEESLKVIQSMCKALHQAHSKSQHDVSYGSSIAYLERIVGGSLEEVQNEE